MQSLYKTILSKFIWASLIPILLIESSLIAALFWMNNRQTNETKEALATISTDSFTEIAQHTSKQVEQQLSQARTQIDQLDLFAESFFLNPQRYSYPALQIYYDQGFYRDGVRGGLSSVYTTNHSTLNHSDLNRLINRMNQLELNIDFSECFNVVSLPEGQDLYTLNIEEYAEEAELIDLYFDHPIIQKIA